MIDIIITLAIVLLAAGYVVYRLTGDCKDESSCGCHCSDCPSSSTGCPEACHNEKSPNDPI